MIVGSNSRASKSNYYHKKRSGQKYTDITPKWLRNLYRKSKHCPVCGQKMVDGKHSPGHPSAKTLDHKVPLSQGGGHIKRNVWYICLTCHRGKDEAKPGGK